MEFVVPAGTGGGADQMARVIQGIVTKHALMKQSMIVVNKSGGAGGEGFLDVKGAKGNPHKLVITLSNLFTTPLATGIPFSWKDLTPVAMMALDEFVLWVPADAPYKTAPEYIAAGAARLVDDDHRLFHQGMLGDDALDDARHLIGAAAGSGRWNSLCRPGRLPCGGGRGAVAQQNGGTRGRRKSPCRNLRQLT